MQPVPISLVVGEKGSGVTTLLDAYRQRPDTRETLIVDGGQRGLPETWDSDAIATWLGYHRTDRASRAGIVLAAGDQSAPRHLLQALAENPDLAATYRLDAVTGAASSLTLSEAAGRVCAGPDGTVEREEGRGSTIAIDPELHRFFATADRIILTHTDRVRPGAVGVICMELNVDFSVVQEDAFQCSVDVLILKYARELYGLDRAIFTHLTSQNIQVELPDLDASELVNTRASMKPERVLFLGVKPLRQFGYTEIREFARLAMQHLSIKAPNTRSVALTIHGPGYGLDEVEAFEAELAGVVEAIYARTFPAKLESVIFVERDLGRVSRLSDALSKIVPEAGLPFNGGGSLNRLGERAQMTLRTAGYSSLSKAHVFVAMPFAKEMADVFHYGIQGAVHSQGLLCERADLSAFTGDVLDWVRQRISSARLVIADLSTANPNVYLEVGYAWGCQVPTVLLSKNESDLAGCGKRVAVSELM